MRYPIKYLNFTHFLLEKRKSIEGLNSAIIFNIEELRPYDLANLEEIKQLLNVMRTEMVWIKSESGQEHEVKLLESADISEPKITIKNCSMDRLESYELKIKRKLKFSAIQINKRGHILEIKYANGDWIPLSNALPKRIFICLHRNFPEIVEYKTMAEEIKNCSMVALGTLAEKKKIQNTINNIKKRIKNTNIPEDFIKAIDNVGYRLII